MKQQVHPAVVAIAVALVVGVVIFFYRREMGNVGDLPPGAVGHAGPFSPGGAAVSGGKQAQAHPPQATAGGARPSGPSR